VREQVARAGSDEHRTKLMKDPDESVRIHAKVRQDEVNMRKRSAVWHESTESLLQKVKRIINE
jgi:hypothetical protein